MNLNQQQIDELQLIANTGGTGARVNYYTKLASWGLRYGEIGLSVALEHEIGGRVANEFFMSVASDEGIMVSGSQWQSIGDSLMKADLAARKLNTSIDTDGDIIYLDLEYFQIKDYHQDVYGNLGGTVPSGQGVSIQAWTAYAPVMALGVDAWDAMLADGIVNLAAFVGSMASAAFRDGDPHALLWLGTSVKIWETVFGTGSPLMFPNEMDGAEIIIGTLDDDEASIFVPSAINQKKVFLGLGGEDIFDISGAEGTQHFYDGGDGDDRFVIVGQAEALINGSLGEDMIEVSSIASSTTFQIRHADHFSRISGPAEIGFKSVEMITGSANADEFLFIDVPFLTGVQSIDGGDGNDLLVMTDEVHTHSAGDRYLDLTSGLYGNFTRISGIEYVQGSRNDDHVKGNNSNNFVLAQAGADEIRGMAGNDKIYGGAGNDTLSGGAGLDSLYGDDGVDKVYGDGEDDKIYGYAGEDELYGGAGNDSLLGGADQDKLHGEVGNDTLRAEGGIDVLAGGPGINVLYGGDGSDTFTFGYGTDYVMDFLLGTDRLLNHDYISPSYSQSGTYVKISGAGGTMYLANCSLSDVQNAHDNFFLWA